MRKIYISIGILIIVLITLLFYFTLTPQTAQNETTVDSEATTTIATKDDLIKLYSPTAGAEIASPLIVTGEARGTWFFEATFPIILTDWDGLIIAEGYATAEDDWMTEEYVDFSGTLNFTKPNVPYDRGSLILQKSNPSGLPEHDNALEIQIQYE